MSITVNTLPILSPVYSDNFKLKATESVQQDLSYYKFEVYVNSTLLDEFIYFPDPEDGSAEIDLSPILSTYFESEVYIPTGTTMFEEIPDSIPNYNVTITSYSVQDTVYDIHYVTFRYFWNGCFNVSDDYTTSDFIMSSTDSGNFLTKWATPREITLTDTAYINYISGFYGVGLNNEFGGLSISKTTKNGDEIAQPFYHSSTNKNIFNIDVSPAMINTTYPDFINEDVLYYTITEINGYETTPMRINIVDERKITKFYNFNYINQLGGVDFFTATKVSEIELDIDRMILDQFTIQKQYNTNVEEEITVLTQPLNAAQADGLKGLFISPAVKLITDVNEFDVSITNSKMVINDRYPKVSLIQYQITFKYNNKYYTQKY